jgi:DHA1 family tetracycline resistance protein-like MFS transporter
MQGTRTRRSGAVSFILTTAFLNQGGVGLLNPVFPFIVSKYVAKQDAAFAIAALYTAFSLFQFIAVPTLGALSDRYGRRSVLLISLIGSAVGYLIFGLGGALWVLFLGRILDGITGGNLAAINAFAADITKPADRTRFFGLIGAFGSMGFVIGPAIGGIVYTLSRSIEAPLFFAAAVTLANAIWGYYVMPESLPEEKRDKQITLARLNPLTQLRYVFAMTQLRLLLAGVMLWMLAFSMLQSNLSYLTEDRLGWSPDGTSAIFFTIGLVSILIQAFAVRWLLTIMSEARMAIIGLASLFTGFLLLAFIAITGIAPLVFVAVVFTGAGNSLTATSLNGLLSRSVSVREQGRVQGGSQSIQALGRVLGPLWGGWAYGRIGQSAPYLSGALGLGLGIFAVIRAVPVLNAHHAKMAEANRRETETT